MNDIKNGKNHKDQNLLSNSTDDSKTGITAGNIGISKGWTSGTVHISTDGTNRTDTILDMIAAMKDTKKLNGKTFADYMNNLSTQLASDSRLTPERESLESWILFKTVVPVFNAVWLELESDASWVERLFI